MGRTRGGGESHEEGGDDAKQKGEGGGGRGRPDDARATRELRESRAHEASSWTAGIHMMPFIWHSGGLGDGVRERVEAAGCCIVAHRGIPWGIGKVWGGKGAHRGLGRMNREYVGGAGQGATARRRREGD